MTSKNKTTKSIILVTLSNVTSIVSGVFTSFMLPMILNVEDYSYYKSFTLYLTYIGIFSIGIVEGIFLKYGGSDFESLDQERFRAFFKFYFIVQLLFAVLISSISLIFLRGNYLFIFILIAIYMLANNITVYFQSLSQITQRFREYSLRNIIRSILLSITVVILFLINKYSENAGDYKMYIILYTFATYLLCVWYVVTYRQLIFGKHLKITQIKEDILYFIKMGFPLFFANLCGTLILSLDRQFVNILFPYEDYPGVYANYAFAYNMLTLVTVATSAVSTVIYPVLKRESKDFLIDNYALLKTIIVIFVSFMLCAYFPLTIIIELILPKYIDSLSFFKIIFPGLLLSSCITVVMHNYYNTLGISQKYFIICLIILLLSFVFNTVAYIFSKSPTIISIVSIIAMLIWYIVAEAYLRKKYKVKDFKTFFYILAIMSTFYIISYLVKNIYLGLGIYVIAFAILTFVFYRCDYLKIKKMIIK